MKEKILIYDDEQPQTEAFKKNLLRGLKKAELDENFSIEILPEKDLPCLITTLQDRQIRSREDKGYSDNDNDIDSTSIFIIDYDLLESPIDGFLSGENIAYSVRCFSKCRLIIGLNQFGSNAFDLTLRGHPESFADLNLGEEQLGNPDLWRGTWSELRRTFRPWYWPNLSDALRAFDKRVEEVREKIWTNPFARFLVSTPMCFGCFPAPLFNSSGRAKVKYRLKQRFGSSSQNPATA